MSRSNQIPDVYTDGSCRNQGNPNAQAGYGVFWGQGHINNRSGTVSGHQDSNRAELRAAQQAIQTASRQGYSGINIHSDSHISIRIMSDIRSIILQNIRVLQQIVILFNPSMQ